MSQFCEKAYGEKYTEAVEQFGLKLSTAQQWAWVSNVYEPSNRLEVLSHKHHMDAASLPPDERQEALEWAATQKEIGERLGVSRQSAQLDANNSQLGKIGTDLGPDWNENGIGEGCEEFPVGKYSHRPIHKPRSPSRAIEPSIAPKSRNGVHHMTIVTSQQAVAKFFGISTTCISRDWRALGMPGGSGRYDLSEIARWRIDLERAKVKQSADWALGDGPALERFRNAKAGIAELDLAERAGTMVDVNQIRDGMSRAAGIIRRAGEQLKREFGNEALGILNDALDEFERLIDSDFGA